jgi:ligand-binding sensor domain-containing protein/serine phosphatase RsbU (regulator of sigma subunit)
VTEKTDISRVVKYFLHPLIIFSILCSCSQNNEQYAIAKGISDTLPEPQIVVLANLPDSSKPVELFLENAPKPFVTAIPKIIGNSYSAQTLNGIQTIKLKPPTILSFIDTTTHLPISADAQGAGFFTNYTTSNGLPLDNITCSTIDRMGNIWFGTTGGGASRYDGKSFINYTTTQGLASNIVFRITEDKMGNIWFGTQEGVSCYDGKSFTTYTTAQGLANNTVWCITEDKAGNIWLGTQGGGISCYDGRQKSGGFLGEPVHWFTNYTTAQGLADNTVLSIMEDRNANIWFGTNGGGVSCYNPSITKTGSKIFTNYTTAEGLAHNTVTSIAEDKTGTIWFGTRGGVSTYNTSATGTSTKKFVNYTKEQGLADNSVHSILEDRAGNIWLGTSAGGVSCYTPSASSKAGNALFTNFTTAQGLANNAVLSITEDKTGNIWFGTYGGGASCYKGKSFSNFTKTQGLGNNSIWCITEDKKQNVWFGTNGGGLSCYDGASLTNFNMAQGLANNVVVCSKADKKGNIWFGTNGGGVSCYDGKSFTNYSTAQGLVSNSIFSICEDKTGNLWFGTDLGVSRYNGKSFTNFSTSQGLANNSVYSITEDKDETIWFGEEEGHISSYDGKSFTNYTITLGLANNTIWNILVDKTENIWFATSGGLLRYDGESFMNFTTREGLVDNFVTQVIQDKQGNIWVGTNLGISELYFQSKKGLPIKKSVGLLNINNKELKNYIPVFETYNSNNGYPVKDVNTGQGGMFEDSKGIIWIATGSDKTGLVRFNPEAVNKNFNSPTVFIQSIKINNSTICWGDLNQQKLNRNKNAKKKWDMPNESLAIVNEEVTTFGKILTDVDRDTMCTKFSDIKFDSITKWYPLPENLILPYDHNNIIFDFGAIETDRNFLVHYQYILEGYDKDWSPITEKTSASFGNINEGTYTFKLKARSPFGLWSDPITYTFRVLPPWWRTWWMYLFYAVFIIYLATRFIKRREQNLKKEKAILEEKVEQRTKELADRNKVVEKKHKEITDSINYAERIQRSLLASKELLDANLKEYFVFFQPKDIVSGDFYWASKLHNNQFALVTADSTGHGVPGAIMSILNISCLEKAVEAQKLIQPSEILNHTRIKIIETLKKDGSIDGGKEGMDCSLVCFDFKNYKLTYAIANSSVWIVRNKQIIVFARDKMPVGKHDKDTIPFAQHTFEIQKGDLVYTLTDGFVDQFGGPDGKKLMSSRLKELLISISHLSMQEQKEKLSFTLNTWKGNLDQVDDITVIGVKI